MLYSLEHTLEPYSAFSLRRICDSKKTAFLLYTFLSILLECLCSKLD